MTEGEAYFLAKKTEALTANNGPDSVWSAARFAIMAKLVGSGYDLDHLASLAEGKIVIAGEEFTLTHLEGGFELLEHKDFTNAMATHANAELLALTFHPDNRAKPYLHRVLLHSLWNDFVKDYFSNYRYQRQLAIEITNTAREANHPNTRSSLICMNYEPLEQSDPLALALPSWNQNKEFWTDYLGIPENVLNARMTKTGKVSERHIFVCEDSGSTDFACGNDFPGFLLFALTNGRFASIEEAAANISGHEASHLTLDTLLLRILELKNDNNPLYEAVASYLSRNGNYLLKGAEGGPAEQKITGDEFPHLHGFNDRLANYSTLAEDIQARMNYREAPRVLQALDYLLYTIGHKDRKKRSIHLAIIMIDAAGNAFDHKEAKDKPEQEYNDCVVSDFFNELVHLVCEEWSNSDLEDKSDLLSQKIIDDSSEGLLRAKRLVEEFIIQPIDYLL